MIDRLSSPARLGFAILVLALLTAVASAQTGPVGYTVKLGPRPTSHLVHVSLSVKFTGGASWFDVAMPAWSPGAYGIHNAWRNVQEFRANDETGRNLRFEKQDKQTWRIFVGSPGPLRDPIGMDPRELEDRKGRVGSSSSNPVITASYKLYLRDYNEELCYLRGPSVFMYVVGHAVGGSRYPLAGPVSVRLEAPSPAWRIQTGMEPGAEPNSFVADSYDTFIDSSIVLGVNWEQTQFEHQGSTYYVVFIGKGNYDKERITRDTKIYCSYFVDLMGGTPYKKYVFFLRARGGTGSGGLEHLNSTDMSFPAWSLHSTGPFYNRFLFVGAHEFFHLWNVKRIRPAILGPFDYSREQHTRNLYVSEGMTSYWAALGLKRCGLWSRKDYYDDLATQIDTLQSAPGRRIMSVELSSWDTWNTGDNAQNNRINYYNKGQLIGNLLDLEIRHRTGNQRSLTDVFLYLLKNHGLPKPGFEEVRGFRDSVELIVKQAAPDKSDFGNFFQKYVSGVEEIPWNDFLGHAGLILEEKKAAPVPSLGLTTGTSLPTAGGNIFGRQTTPLPANQIAITNVEPGSTGEDAGLDVGDVLVSMDGDRVDPEEFDRRLAEKKIGSTVVLAVMRRDQLKSISVTVGSREKITYSIREKPDVTELQKQIFMSWLGEKKFEP